MYEIVKYTYSIYHYTIYIVKAYLIRLLSEYDMSRTLKGPEEELSPTLQVSKVSESVEIERPTEVKEIPPAKLSIRNLEAWFGTKRALKGINLDVRENSITAFIGPSGCGKTTLIRCLNRMHEMTPGASAKGQAILDGMDMYDAKVDPVTIKRRIGMVFQKPNPFPTMSIYDNVAAGLKLNGIKDKKLIDDIVRESLEGAVLWEEVKNELNKPGMGLSGGQQQRLCIARALAMQPEILLMDEPTSALDPIASSKIEELVHGMKKDLTVVIVTHNMQQAARVSDYTAFMYLGELIEYGDTKQIFENPRMELTERYISGKFG
jgi:phosphate transport system ATP-binding protein